MAEPASTTMNGADILVESLIRHGVDTVFAYPGGASMPLHQSLTKVTEKIRTILPRHEQGGGFMAQGYARTTGKVSVCMATSGPGATNFVTVLASTSTVTRSPSRVMIIVRQSDCGLTGSDSACASE